MTDEERAADAERRLLGPYWFLDAIAETANITRLPDESDDDLRARIDKQIGKRFANDRRRKGRRR